MSEHLTLPGQVIIRIDDKKRTMGAIVTNPEECKSFNDDGWGIFFTPNSFRTPTKEEHKANVTKTPRNEQYLTGINFVYGDLDVAKDGEKTTQEEIDKRKQTLQEALEEHCCPNFIIITRNGLQPLWALSDSSPDQGVLAKRVMCGIIEWSGEYGGKKDNVKDLARVLRTPEYTHNKQEPYMVELIEYDVPKYTLEALLAKFPYEELAPGQAPEEEDNIFSGVDIKDIAIKAFKEIGREASFDKQLRLTLDGRLTGTFQGKKGARQYIATTSGQDPYEGNKITVVSQILGLNNKEAAEWVQKNFEPKKAKAIPFLSWSSLATSTLDFQNYLQGQDLAQFHFAPLDKMFGGILPTDLITVGADTGCGKSDFLLHIAYKNAQQGKKVLFFQLEMDEHEIMVRRLLQRANAALGSNYITPRDMRIFNISDKQKEEIGKAVIEEQKSIGENIQVYSGGAMKFDDFSAALEKIHGFDLLVLDHVHYFSMDGKSDSMATNLSDVMRKMRTIVKTHKIPIILASHLRKRDMLKEPELVDLHGSGDIAKESTCVIMIHRDREKTEDGAYELTGRTSLYVRKSRGTGDLGEPIYCTFDPILRELVPDEPPATFETTKLPI